MLLEHLGVPAAAGRIRAALEKSIAAGKVTADLAAQVPGAKIVGCAAFGDLVGTNL
jgi:isocitrate dehydrogenase